MNNRDSPHCLSEEMYSMLGTALGALRVMIEFSNSTFTGTRGTYALHVLFLLLKQISFVAAETINASEKKREEATRARLSYHTTDSDSRAEKGGGESIATHT